MPTSNPNTMPTVSPSAPPSTQPSSFPSEPSTHWSSAIPSSRPSVRPSTLPPTSQPVVPPHPTRGPGSIPSCHMAFARCSKHATITKFTDSPLHLYGVQNYFGCTNQVRTLSLKCELWTSRPRLVGSVAISSQSFEINLHAKLYSANIHFYHGSTMIPLSSNGQTYTTDHSQYRLLIPPTEGQTVAQFSQNARVEIGE